MSQTVMVWHCVVWSVGTNLLSLGLIWYPLLGLHDCTSQNAKQGNSESNTGLLAVWWGRLFLWKHWWLSTGEHSIASQKPVYSSWSSLRETQIQQTWLNYSFPFFIKNLSVSWVRVRSILTFTLYGYSPEVSHMPIGILQSKNSN